MITLPLAFAVLLLTAFGVRLQTGARRRTFLHLLVVSAMVFVVALSRAAWSGGLNQCALELATSGQHAFAKVHR